MQDVASGTPARCRQPKSPLKLRKLKLAFSHTWAVMGLLYLLPSLCPPAKWEVRGRWKRKDGVIGVRGPVRQRGRLQTMQRGAGKAESLRGAGRTPWDNWLCPALRGSRKLVTVTQGRSRAAGLHTGLSAHGSPAPGPCRWTVQCWEPGLV